MTFDHAAYLAAEKRLHEAAVEYARNRGSVLALDALFDAVIDYEKAARP